MATATIHIALLASTLLRSQFRVLLKDLTILGKHELSCGAEEALFCMPNTLSATIFLLFRAVPHCLLSANAGTE